MIENAHMSSESSSELARLVPEGRLERWAPGLFAGVGVLMITVAAFGDLESAASWPFVQ